MPAELGRSAEQVFGAVGAREQLAAEADAEHGAVAVAEIAHQGEQRREIRADRIVERVLAAAEHDQRVMPGCILRQVLALVGPAKVDFGICLGKRRAELAKALVLEILDHQDPHRRAPREAARRNRLRCLPLFKASDSSENRFALFGPMLQTSARIS